MIINESGQITKTGQDYVQELLNIREHTETQTEIEQQQEKPPGLQEVEEAIFTLKMAKASGID